MNGRPWTPIQDQFIRDVVPTGLWTPAELADAWGRPAGQVYQRMAKLGVRTPKYKRLVGGPARARVPALHAEGLSDREIAERIGCDRRYVNTLRHRLGLPLNREATYRGRLLAVANQRKSLGIRHGGDLRAYAFRKFAVANGWPEDLRPREVQVLNALAVHGPQTRLELSGRIGMRVDREDRPGHLGLLSGNGPGGTYTATLMRRGLVMRQKRSARGLCRDGRHRARQIGSVYMLTAAAVELVQRRLANGKSESQSA